jgi:hypothetical protein
MNWLGLDIGGANLKIADGMGYAQSVSFALWRHPRRLAAELRKLLAAAPEHEALAVTMTGELADCYATKADGVAAIVRAATSAAARRIVMFYSTDGAWYAPAAAARQPLLVASANWFALASFACRYLQAPGGLLLDVGSTTSDVVPLIGGEVAAEGRIDPERLMLGELVYTGVARSPLCAVVSVVPWRDAKCPTAQEVFATMSDVYVTLGDLPEDAAADNTADGRGQTRELALDRLARSICADRTMFGEADATAVAQAAQEAQLAKLGVAVCRVADRMEESPESVVVAGQGEFLARRVLDRLGWNLPCVSLSERLGPAVSRCATAHALAVLAREQLS